MKQSPEEDAQRRVEKVLEEELERIESLEAAHAAIERAERLTAGHTEADSGDAAARHTVAAPDQPAAAATCIERAAQPTQPERSVADVLATTAAQSVAQSPASEPVLAAAQATLAPEAVVSPRARRGRRLLKDALLRRMGPVNALDARIYLAINEAPHPPALDSLAWALALVTTGGWIWLLGSLVAYLLHVPRSWLAFKRLASSMLVATWIIEHPIKSFFRRKRPFSRIVEALVIGKKPGSWSFPSGHTAASFASAWTLSLVWPRGASAFFGAAGLVGLSRIYVGAHYPGDVGSGALLGVALSELIRRLWSRVFA
ncbi:MAG: phosphatase PAP2 family protein [Chloroflexota bacterium]|nr:phosphatase PAP2 family protein [Chloroflexota bacterium]